MFENFTACAMRSIAIAIDKTHAFERQKVDTDLLLLAIITDRNIAAPMLLEHGISKDATKRLITSGCVNTPTVIPIPFEPACKHVLKKAQELARQMNHAQVTTAHLLLSIVTSPECDGAQILEAVKAKCLSSLEGVIKAQLVEAMKEPMVEHIEQPTLTREEQLDKMVEIARRFPDDWEEQMKTILSACGITAAEIRAELRKKLSFE